MSTERGKRKIEVENGSSPYYSQQSIVLADEELYMNELKD